MITSNDQIIEEKPRVDFPHIHSETTSAGDPSLATTQDTYQQLLLPSKFITHHPKSGLNPLVDAAAYLFSVAGKLRQVKLYRHLNKLHKELVAAIDTFQDAVKTQGYSSEYILVSRYALCAMLDDIISNTPWGAQGQWEGYSLLTTFNQENAHQDRFFIILERIVKDPALYIDLMEFMYICLNLGFKGQYRSTEFSTYQLEQITNALYKRIRAYRGDFSKILSPLPIKAEHTVKPKKKSTPLWAVMLFAASTILVLFISLGYMLDRASKQTYQDLMHIGQTTSYETNEQL